MKITMKFAHLILLAFTKESSLCLIFTLCSLQGNEIKKIIFHDDLHDYYTSNPNDSFSELIPLFQLGKLTLPFNSDEKEMVRQLLQKLIFLFHHKLWFFRILAYSLVKLVPTAQEQFIFLMIYTLVMYRMDKLKLLELIHKEELFHTSSVCQKKKGNNSLLFQGHESA